ncbi:hypothetical protein QPK87_25295 [Kamptonema cortianum]|nr:hypothetical protein [Kamptonema cortianum]
MRPFQIDLTRNHPYLRTHAQRYFARREIAPSLAQDSLERAANYTGIYEYGDTWTPEIEAEIIRILTQFSNR